MNKQKPNYTLVEKAKATSNIVIDDSAGEVELEVAHELQYYLKKISKLLMILMMKKRYITHN